MTTEIRHWLRKKLYPQAKFFDYCIKRYAREQAEARRCDCKKQRLRCGHPGGWRPPPIRIRSRPPFNELVKAAKNAGKVTVLEETMTVTRLEPCRTCKGLREDYAMQCKQMKPACPTCGRTKRKFGRCADNWHSGDCSIVYY